MRGVAAVTNVVNPIGDDSRVRRLLKVVGWIVVAAAVLALLQLLGVDVGGWIAGLWTTLHSVPTKYLLAAVALQTLQTTLTGSAWLFILRAGFPHAHIPFAPVLTAYAAGSALNGVLPASLGTFVTLFMFVAIIPNATFAGVLAGYLVQRIFFTIIGALVYVYLFVSVPGSFSLELGGLRTRPLLTACIVAGAVLLIVLVGRAFWAKLHSQWLQAKQGGAILAAPRAYVVRVVLPSLAGYTAKLASIAVFLAAFAIPVSFTSVMHVVGGNSVAGSTSVTPGGAGVNEAVTVVALARYTDAQTATAFSVEQHLVGTGWNVLFALILVSTVFGWRNGEALVKSSYAQAKKREPSPKTVGDPQPLR
ncbi:MAG: glycosyltransferase AglD [Gaiellaceae bacterium]|nr:glycosyltransferase AglD [Gaiellaceae bacterium]